MDLLNLCLTSIYFQYYEKHYKQLHGTAMGSPVSVVVAEIVMQHVEQRALATCQYHFGCDTLTTLLPPFTKTKLTLFTTTLMNRTPTSSLPKKSKKMENLLSRLLGKPQQQRTANDSVQKTDAYRQIT